jgi:hypothetical protein
MKINSRVHAVLALDKLIEYNHSIECKKYKNPLSHCNCGMDERNELIEELKKFITKKK